MPGLDRVWLLLQDAGQRLMSIELVSRLAYHQLLVVHTADDLLTATEETLGLDCLLTALLTGVIFIALAVLCRQNKQSLAVLTEEKSTKLKDTQLYLHRCRKLYAQ